MKKFGVSLLFFITFIIIYILQANLFSNLQIAGVVPNLFVIFILWIGLFANATSALIFGIIMGLSLDLIYGKVIGITAIMLCIIGYLGAYFDKNFSKESKLKIIFMVIGATIIYELGYYALTGLIIGFDFEWLNFTRIVIFEVIYNVLITILLYPLIQNLGYKVDRVFKKNNILTRYF
jgi:rod shape-determining protein MreD